MFLLTLLATYHASLADRVEDLTWRQDLFFWENLGIVLGYLFVAFRITAILPVRLVTRVAAVGFFMTCALTHFEQALHTVIGRDETWGYLSNEWHMLLIHTPQVISVWVFMYCLLGDLRRLRLERGTSGPAKEMP